MSFNPLNYPICFEKPQRLTDVTSWHEHIPFAFTIVQMLKPKIFVELGTHKGDSYCAFCQAVNVSVLDTACYAVDTWEGDEHSGLYGPEILEELKTYHDSLYKGFSQLIQSRFEEALDYFSDGSIDLIHIDGCHTYDAVKHDFEAWLPKMSQCGVVLLHDLNVHEREFGVWKFWEEVAEHYPCFEFKHGYGLGVLAVGAEVPEEVLAFLNMEEHEVVATTKLYSYLGGKIALAHQLQSKDVQITELNSTVQAGDTQVTELNSIVQARDTQITELNSAVQVRDTQITELNSIVQAGDTQITELNSALQARDTQITELNSIVQARDTQITELNSTVQAGDTQITELNGALQSRDEQVTELNGALQARDTQITELNSALQSMQQSIVWRLLMKYHSGFVDRLLSHGTGRRKLYDLGIIGLGTIANEGWKNFLWKCKRYMKTYNNSKIKGHQCIDYKSSFTEQNNHLNQYVGELFNRASQKSKEYIPLSSRLDDSMEVDIKSIAFYLPQFHPIPENDEWWGKGFTEWTNVSKAVPQFVGHYQPRLPDELGFYDLRLLDTQKRQVELAKQHAIYGFCFYYYWFNGKKLLDKPLNQFVQNLEIDFPFCICWANENWTRKWDGLDNDILMGQNHSEYDDLKFIEHVSKLFSDSRYIKINGKPLLIIYRPDLFPKPYETAKIWREYCKKSGIGDIYLVTTHSFKHINPLEIGYDAAIEFAPNTFQLTSLNDKIDFANPNYQGQIYDYRSAMEYAKNYKKPLYKKFRGICPSWDNEARKSGKSIVLHNSSPSNYKKWLEHICHYTDEHFEDGEKLIFINAWNEWAEGAYLEPDRRYGYAYLEATRQVLEQFKSTKTELIKSSQKYKKNHEIAVILHLYYLDQWPEIKKYLSNLNGNFDLYISLNGNCTSKEIKEILKEYSMAQLFIFENRGRDILPFCNILNSICDLNYNYVCKIHTKKSLHRIDGKIWRRELFEGLLGSENRIKEILNIFNTDSNIGMLVPKKYLLNYKDWIGSNENELKQLCYKLDLNYTQDFVFSGGSMFWFKPKCLKKLLRLLNSADFEFEDEQIDGTLAHVFERLFGLVVTSEGFEIGAIK